MVKTRVDPAKKVFETHDSSSDEENDQEFQVLFVPGQDLATYGFNTTKKRPKKLQAADTLEQLKRRRSQDDSEGLPTPSSSSAVATPRKQNRSRNSVEFEVIYGAFVVFKEIHGHLNVHKDFVVPRDDRYAQEAWGLLLGRRLYCMRTENTYPEQRDRLLELGIAFDIKAKHNKPHKPPHVVTFDVLYAALVKYKEIHGTVDVPCRYIIGADDKRFAEEARELPLGSRLRRIRENKTCLEHRDILEQLGVRFIAEGAPKKPTPKIVDFEVIFECFEIYKRLNGDLNIPYNYVVPEGDAEYPEHAWGLRIGHRMQHIRNDNAYVEHKDRLVALGVSYDKASQSWEPIQAALLAYKKVYRNLDVPQKFVVPHGDDTFPESVWGLALGRRVNLIRSRNTYPEHRQDLLDMGFSFDLTKLPEIDFKVFYDALTAYKKVKGDVRVPVRFVVPVEDDEYPEEAWGMKLGSYLQRARTSNTFIDHRPKLIKLGVKFYAEDWNGSEDEGGEEGHELVNNNNHSRVKAINDVNGIDDDDDSMSSV